MFYKTFSGISGVMEIILTYSIYAYASVNFSVLHYCTTIILFFFILKYNTEQRYMIPLYIYIYIYMP